MSVDKFGRYSSDGLYYANSLKRSAGLPQTPDGDYDMSNKRLKNIKDPTDENDAINLKILKEKISPTLRLQNNTYDAEDHRIINVGKPNQNGDAINKGYLSSELKNTLKFNGKTYSANNKRISNVDDPKDAKDSVNRRYLHSLIPEKTRDGFSFYKFVINDIGYPKNENDAVNLKYIKDHCVTRDVGVIDCLGNCLANVKDGSAPSDGATVGQMKETLKQETSGFVKQDQVVSRQGDVFVQGNEKFTLLEEKNKVIDGYVLRNNVWDGKGKQMIHLAPASLPGNVVTFEQIIQLEPTGHRWWNCNNKRLTRVADPDYVDDAVNINFLVKVIGNIMFDMHNYIASGQYNHVDEKMRNSWIKQEVFYKYFFTKTTQP